MVAMASELEIPYISRFPPLPFKMSKFIFLKIDECTYYLRLVSPTFDWVNVIEYNEYKRTSEIETKTVCGFAHKIWKFYRLIRLQKQPRC